MLLLGFGAIGRHVAQLLSPELAAGTLSLTALVSDRAKHDGHPNHGAEVVDLPGLARLAGRADIDTSPSPRMFDGFDVIVECAGVPAAAQLGPSAIASGRPLVLTSVGALAAPEARAGLLAGPGRLYVTNGAIGGLDVLEAAAQADGLDTVEITTSKEASGLIRPWMSETEAARLRDLRPGDGPLTVFTGNPAEAIEKFPANVNIAVALAWATRGQSAGTSDADMLGASLERVQVVLQAVAGQTQSAHRIRAAGSAGEFTFDIRSTPSPENPATSGLTALSVTRTLRNVIAG